MISQTAYDEDAMGAVSPLGASSVSLTEADHQGRPDADGAPPSASGELYPFAGLFELAIDGVATVAADFVRERLRRIVHSGTPSDDAGTAEAPSEQTAQTDAQASDQRIQALLVTVAVAALATGILWYIREKEKKRVAD